MSPRRLTLPTGEVRTVPRVTEIIEAGMPAPELEEWKLKDLASFAAANPHRDADILLTRWRGHSHRHADRGTAVHRWIAAFLTGRPVKSDPLLAGYVAAFRAWYLDHGPRTLTARVEQMLADYDVTVCGTADWICDGRLYDWKTAEKRSDHPPWPSHVAQIGAYCSMSRYVDEHRVGPPDWRGTAFRAASIVRLYADGTFEEDVYEDEKLADAKTLWETVRTVARAVTRDRDQTDADTKEK